MREKHGCGTKLASVPRRLRSWVQKIGVQRASRSWARQSGQGSLWPGWWQNDWWRNRSCGTRCPGSLTGSAQVLVQCAGPRCHHFLRTLPPSQTGEHADGHDLGMMQAMESLLGGLTGEVSHRLWAHHLASLPMRLGGLGLRSARRMSQACLGELQDAARPLDLQGFVTRPSLAEFSRGKLPPLADSSEPDEWQHGWQFHASEQFFRETVVSAQSWFGQMMNGRWRCWRQGFPSTTERGWQQRFVQCWSEPVPKKRRSTPSSLGNRCHLVVVGMETGGRWSTEATTFVDLLAAGRAREVPHVLRRSTHLATWRGTEGARLDLPDLFGEL